MAQDDQSNMSSGKEDAFEVISNLLSSRNSNQNTSQVQPLQSLDPEADGKHAENEDKRTSTHLKRMYAYSFIGILIIQLILMNLIFIAVGLKWISFPNFALHLYMGGTLAEVFGIVLVITRHLFPKK